MSFEKVFSGEQSYYLHLGDCLTYIQKLPDNCIDLTVTSPPYDNLRTYSNTLNWSDEIWKPIIKELYRTTQKGGVVVWVVNDATIKGSETGTSFRQALWGMECGFNLHDTMIYHRQNLPLTHNRYEQHFEYMFIFSKNKPKTFNPLLKENKYFNEKKYGMKTETKATRDKNSLASSAKKAIVKKQGIKGNIWSYLTGYMHSTKDEIAFQHPAIFPEQLAEDHIISWSNVNDLIFDPFTGSGTTAKVAKRLNRRFIGCEINPDYLRIAKARIDQALNEPKQEALLND